MTGEQMTLVLGLVVFGVMVVLLSRSRAKQAENVAKGKPRPVKARKKRRS